MPDEPRCNVYRFFLLSGCRRWIMRGVPLSIAKLHCSSAQTSSATCTTAEGNRRTARSGPWFDAYIKQGEE